jgi:hypothetical protein
MSALKDSGHHWWQQCQRCRMAWLGGNKPDGVDQDVTCAKCDADDSRVVAADVGARAEGYAAAKEQAATIAENVASLFRTNASGGQSAAEAAARIRAMQDEGGES